MKAVKKISSPKLASIQRKAYEIYQKRLKEHKTGDAVSDWVEAEKALKEYEK